MDNNDFIKRYYFDERGKVLLEYIMNILNKDILGGDIIIDIYDVVGKVDMKEINREVGEIELN